jgi:AraC-like DNA-binding protein
VSDERVRVWRGGDDRVLLMAGQTHRYAIEPRGEYVFGTVAGEPMRARRGREVHAVHPGQLVAWDPSGAHSGTAPSGRPWTSRLMVVETARLAALASDEDDLVEPGVCFPDPVVSDPRLASAFSALHRSLEGPSTRLERDERLAGWLRAITNRASSRPVTTSPTSRDERALRRAGDYLAEHALENVALDDLAAVAGVGKFRLIRMVRRRTGLTPHALQIAHRVRHARHLLERGETVAHTAAASGFGDQSHLHRHFTRTLGITPAAYRRCFHP